MASLVRWLLPCLVVLSACSGSDTTTPPVTPADASMDAVADTGPPDVTTAMDAGMDAVGDTGPAPMADVCPDALSDGNCLMCTAGQRVCNGACVGATDPANGCADPSCTPCAFPHAAAVCGDAGRCAMGACDMGFTDCNHDPADGCETATGTDAHNCGACGRACAVPNATAACVMGACAVGTCTVGFGDCDMMPANGCELPVTADLANCGACGNHCALANATAVCTAGACAVSSCAAGFADCNHMAADGCEAGLQTDAMNCAACGHACALPHASPACRAGACAVGTCDANYGDCDGVAANGCETDLRVTASACGACTLACTYANAVGVCAMSACSMGTCNAGYTDCDRDPMNGCEVHTSVDATNCGTCGRTCDVPNARAGCAGGACTVAACDPGAADCNHSPADGCEVDITGSVANCGACAHACVTPHATPLCGAGVCQIGSCDAGYSDCNMAPGDGCEAHTSVDPDHCGGCGTVCVFPHAARSCADGVCVLGACDPGFGNCDGDPGNGCESRLSTDVDNCGACGTACNASTQVCSGSVCVSF